MAKRTKAPPIDRMLKAAFDKIEAQPTPDILKAHVGRLTGAAPTRKAKS